MVRPPAPPMNPSHSSWSHCSFQTLITIINSSEPFIQLTASLDYAQRHKFSISKTPITLHPKIKPGSPWEESHPQPSTNNSYNNNKIFSFLWWRLSWNPTVNIKITVSWRHLRFNRYRKKKVFSEKYGSQVMIWRGKTTLGLMILRDDRTMKSS